MGFGVQDLPAEHYATQSMNLPNVLVPDELVYGSTPLTVNGFVARSWFMTVTDDSDSEEELEVEKPEVDPAVEAKQEISATSNPPPKEAGAEVKVKFEEPEEPPASVVEAVMETKPLEPGVSEVKTIEQIPPATVGNGDLNNPVAAKIKLERWHAHHAVLEPFVRSHCKLYATLRQHWPQLFEPASPLFRELNGLNSVISSTLFPHLNPSNPAGIVKLRYMVDFLAIPIAYGTTLQDLQRPKEPARLPPSPPPERDTQRSWEIKVTLSSSKSGAAAPPASKRIRIESSSACSALRRDDVSIVTIVLSDSEDSPSVVLPVRKKRNYRIRQT